jgi:hypothetical protein
MSRRLPTRRPVVEMGRHPLSSGRGSPNPPLLDPFTPSPTTAAGNGSRRPASPVPRLLCSRPAYVPLRADLEHLLRRSGPSRVEPTPDPRLPRIPGIWGPTGGGTRRRAKACLARLAARGTAGGPQPAAVVQLVSGLAGSVGGGIRRAGSTGRGSRAGCGQTSGAGRCR